MMFKGMKEWSFTKDVWASIIGAAIGALPFVIQFAVWMSDVQKEQAVQKTEIENIKQQQFLRDQQLQHQLDKMSDDISELNRNIKEYILRRASNDR